MTSGVHLGATTFKGTGSPLLSAAVELWAGPGLLRDLKDFLPGRVRRGDSGSAGPRAETTSLCKFPGCSGLPDVWTIRAT